MSNATRADTQSQGVRVVVDTREPDTLLGDVAAHPLVMECTQQKLEWGDIEIEGVLIERKTVSDLANSITDNRLFKQARGLAETVTESSTDAAVILVEGELLAVSAIRYCELSPNAVRGAIASVMMRAGIPVVPCGERASLVDLAVRLGQKNAANPSTAFGQQQFENDPSLPPTMQMFATIPGIGEKRAEMLYERYPSVSAAVLASQEEFEEIEGIGPHTAETIVQTLQEATE